MEVVPTVISSPSSRTRSRTGTPLTLVPLVDCRSATTTSLPCRRISAWRRLTLGSLRAIVHSGRRPISTVSLPRTIRDPSDRMSEAAGQAVETLADLGRHPVPARPGGGVAADLDLDGAHEHVPLAPGVLPGGVAELPGQDVGEALEAVGVRGRQGDHEDIGRDEAPHPHATQEVHLSGQASADLHGLDATPEGLGERAFHHPLETLLEPLESHRGDPAYRRHLRRTGLPRPASTEMKSHEISCNPP